MAFGETAGSLLRGPAGFLEMSLLAQPATRAGVVRGETTKPVKNDGVVSSASISHSTIGNLAPGLARADTETVG